MRSFKKTIKKQLGELLVERGILNQLQVSEALDVQKKEGGLFGEVLVKLNFATERDIAQALTCQYGFPYLPLMNYEIEPEVLSTVSGELCRKHSLIPIDKIGKSLTLVMANPLNTNAVEDIEAATGCVIQVFVSTTTEINQSIEKHYPAS